MSTNLRGLFRFGRLPRWLAAIASLALTSAAPAAAQRVSPSAAPAEWLHYAEAATATITGWLEADEEAAVRLRAYLDRTRLADGQPTAPLHIKLWIASDGIVSRIGFTPFAHEQANGDLRGLIIGRRLPGSIPPDMLQPIRIAVQLARPDARAPAPASRAVARDIARLEGHGVRHAALPR